MTRASRADAIVGWLRRRGGALAIFLLLIVLWEVGVRATGIKEYLLPPPSKVWTEFWKRHEIVAGGAWVTTQEILAGYALAVVISVPLALWIAYSRFMEQAVYPVIVFLQIIPKIAIAPLFIIWFGFGFTPKLLLVFLLSFFPIVVSSIAGFKSLDPEVMDLARSTGAGDRRCREIHARAERVADAGNEHGPYRGVGAEVAYRIDDAVARGDRQRVLRLWTVADDPADARVRLLDLQRQAERSLVRMLTTETPDPRPPALCCSA